MWVYKADRVRKNIYQLVIKKGIFFPFGWRVRGKGFDGNQNLWGNVMFYVLIPPKNWWAIPASEIARFQKDPRRDPSRKKVYLASSGEKEDGSEDQVVEVYHVRMLIFGIPPSFRYTPPPCSRLTGWNYCLLMTSFFFLLALVRLFNIIQTWVSLNVARDGLVGWGCWG